jgi:hypothetical protein
MISSDKPGFLIEVQADPNVSYRFTEDLCMVYRMIIPGQWFDF